jgi:hypothetical protein
MARIHDDLHVLLCHPDDLSGWRSRPPGNRLPGWRRQAPCAAFFFLTRSCIGELGSSENGFPAISSRYGITAGSNRSRLLVCLFYCNSTGYRLTGGGFARDSRGPSGWREISPFDVAGHWTTGRIPPSARGLSRDWLEFSDETRRFDELDIDVNSLVNISWAKRGGCERPQAQLRRPEHPQTLVSACESTGSGRTGRCGDHCWPATRRASAGSAEGVGKSLHRSVPFSMFGSSEWAFDRYM